MTTSLPGGLTPRRVPEAYLRAEVAAYPLSAEEGFRLAVTELDPEVPLDGPTSRLWRACERDLSTHAGGWSLDRIIAMRDFAWFGDRPGPHQSSPVPLDRYLTALAQVHVQPRPAITEIRRSSDTADFDAVTHYRWLTFAVPEDLVLAGAGVDPPPTKVNLDPPLLVRRLIDRGLAEIHQHVGGGMDFPTLWSSALAALADPTLGDGDMADTGAPFDDGRSLRRWLLVAAIARCALAEHLLDTASSAGGSFQELIAPPGGSTWLPTRRRTLAQAIHALSTGRSEDLPGLDAALDLYAELHPGARDVLARPPQKLAEVEGRCDPVAARLALGNLGAGERWLLRRGLRHLSRPGADPLFAAVFWQVQRVRVQYYRFVVQRPMTAGLTWFIRFYDRLWTMRGPLRDVRPEAAYRVAAGGQQLAALEIRTTPAAAPIGLAEELSRLLASWEEVVDQIGPPAPEFGVVLHFAKQRGNEADRRWRRGSPPAFARGSHADPSLLGQLRAARYATFLTEQAARARAVGELLARVPEVLWLVRGVDVAADELAEPTWITVPLFHHVRTEAHFAAAQLGPWGPPPLAKTAHAGEDFRHLLEGLRRVYEAAHYLLGIPGGRLGHATALGVEPRLWAESVGAVIMPAEDRLWDLVFEWRIYTGYRVDADFGASAPPGRIARVENEIVALSGRLFDACHEARVFAELHHLLHRFLVPPVGGGALDDPHDAPSALALVDAYAHGRHPVSAERVRHADQVLPLLDRVCGDEGVFREGQRLVDIIVDASELAALYAVQGALRAGIAAHGVVVEVNPSSNLLIGDLLDLRNHPILRLFPPEPRDGPPPVPIAVGSDDPLTFSTHLLREYALLFHAGRAAGYSHKAVQDWLEAIRQTSMDARFTVRWPRSARIREALDAYLQRPTRPARG